MVARAKPAEAAETEAEPVVSEDLRRAIAEEVAKVLADHDGASEPEKEEKADDEPAKIAGPREQEADMESKVRAAVEKLKKEDDHAAEHEAMKSKPEPEEPPPTKGSLQDRIRERLWK